MKKKTTDKFLYFVFLKVVVHASFNFAHKSDITVKRPGARFSKVPKTFRDRKAICEIANRLFWKAGLLTCFQGNKKKNNCEV